MAATADGIVVFTIGRVLAAVGGAALVPTATAAATAIAPQGLRGRAIAVVGVGFTLATAVGAPLGIVVAAAAGWRSSMLVLAGGAVALAPAVALVVRKVPIDPPVAVSRRIQVLRDRRIALTLMSTLLVVAGFNLLYLFSATATGYRGRTLATLLLVYGVAGIAGNTLGGPLTDRFGSRAVGAATLLVNVVALVGVAIAGHRFVGLAGTFVVWGLSVFGASVALQHRLLNVDARVGSVAISLYSTALYLALAVAPLLGAAALALGDPTVIPIAAVVVSAAGLVVFLASYQTRALRGLGEA